MTAVLVVLVVLLVLALSMAGASVRVLREYERGVVLPLRSPGRPEGPRHRATRADRRPHGAGVPPHDHAHDPPAGRHHPRQRARPCGCRRVLPRRGRGRLDHRHRGLPAGDVRDREDHAAVRARQGRARHPALRARAPQRGTAAHHRRADRTVGNQGRHRRDQGRGDPPRHAARDGPPGGSRA